MQFGEGNVLTKVAVSSPQSEYFHITDTKVHNITNLADKSKAIRQHDRLKTTIRRFGAELIDLKELDRHPNSVFTRDTSVVTPYGYIRLSMGLPSRRGEEDWMENVLKGLQIPQLGRIELPATAEGGDIILAGKTVFIGNSTRTNVFGIEQLTEIFRRVRYDVRVTSVPSPFLHIGGAMSVINPVTILHVEHVFPKNFFSGFKTIKVPNKTFISGNVITLGSNELIANKENKLTIERLREHNFTVHELNLNEFVKGTGGPSCLIMPVQRK
ncbi:MAG: arginine deiminase family protein [Patescibacteria group bacterium]